MIPAGTDSQLIELFAHASRFVASRSIVSSQVLLVSLLVPSKKRYGFSCCCSEKGLARRRVRHAAAPLIDGTAATDDVACSHHFPLHGPAATAALTATCITGLPIHGAAATALANAGGASAHADADASASAHADPDACVSGAGAVTHQLQL
jgi:hypothetical protein